VQVQFRPPGPQGPVFNPLEPNATSIVRQRPDTLLARVSAMCGQGHGTWEFLTVQSLASHSQFSSRSNTSLRTLATRTGLLCERTRHIEAGGSGRRRWCDRLHTVLLLLVLVVVPRGNRFET
jgi:hypothetical protein